MISRAHVLNLAAALAILLLHPALHSSSDQAGRGGEWLSWTPAQRNQYAFFALPRAPLRLLKVKLAETGVDAGAYTTVLTEFYAKRREYQCIPFAYLMEFLSDSENKTAEQLFKMGRNGEIRTNW